VIRGIGFAAAGNVSGIGDTGSSIVGHSDSNGDGRIAGAGRKRIAASASERAQHAGPACTGNVGSVQTGRQSVGDSYHAAGASEAGVGGGDGVSGAHLSLSEVTTM